MEEGSPMRKSRGIRLTEECMGRLRRLAKATGRSAAAIIEPYVAEYYAEQRRDPVVSRVLDALEQADEALAAVKGPRHGRPDRLT